MTALIQAIISNTIRLPLYILSYLFPRKRNRWAFGSPKNSFSDNSKYLFLHVSKNHKSIEAAWITKNKKIIEKLKHSGYKAYHSWSPAGLIYCLTSKAYIFSSKPNDINFWASGGAIHFNLWHGVGIKNVEHEIKSGPNKNHLKKKVNRLIYPHDFRKPDYLLSTSREMTLHFSKCFKLSERSIFEAGYPRNDQLTDKEYSNKGLFNEEIESTIQKIKNKKSFLYMPTFRDSGENSDNDNFFNLKEIDQICKDKKTIFLIKPHRYTKIKNDKRTYSNIIFINKGYDIYPLLKYINVLITDYSSIYYDFLLTGKPTIFYIYDYNDYIYKNRDLAMPFLENIDGTVCHDFNSLLEKIKKNNLKKPASNKLIKKFWGENYKNSSEKITSFILSKTLKK